MSGTTPGNVAAVLVTRGDVPELLEARVRQFERLGFAELRIWDNSQEPKDRKVMGRYDACLGLESEIVFFQDDDIVLTDQQVLDILAAYEPGILVSNMYDDWIEGMGYLDLAMVGLGAVCDRGLWEEPFGRFIEAYGWLENEERMLLDPDFIFGVLAKWRRYDFGHEILPEASADTRLWKQPGQHERKYETITMARRLRRIVLTMMVKDEQENIQRALNSNHAWWDELLLLDTGSTDHTVDVARAFCEATGKVITVIEAPFTNFREMRDLLITEGRKLADYMLLMDADEEWVNMPAERPELWAHAYMLHYEGSVDWAQPRLISSGFPWRWSGVVHSYLDHHGELEAIAVNLPLQPLIVHHGDARHGTEKAYRDIAALEAELLRTDDDRSRNLFMLGKGHEGLDADKAMEYYRLRLFEPGEPDEETYWCRLRLGVLTCEHLNDFKTGIELLWEAYQERPQRAEALRAISFYCTAVADATPYPEDDMLLVQRNMYRV